MNLASAYYKRLTIACIFLLSVNVNWVYSQTPQQYTQAENSQYLYVSNRNMGRDNEKSDFISQYKIRPDGSLIPLSPRDISTGKGLLDIVAHPSGKFLYAVNTISNTISQYRVGHDGKLVFLAPPIIVASKGVADIRIHPSGKFAYIFARQGILQYAINPNGKLLPLTPALVHTQTLVQTMIFGKTVHFAYAADSSGNIYQYHVEADGTLVHLAPPIQTGSQDQALSQSLSGKFMYDVTWSPYAIRQFLVNDDGTLVGLFPAVIPLVEAPTPLVFDPSGKFGYVANFGTDLIHQFQVRGDGELMPLPELKVPADIEPVGVTFDKSGKFAYGLSNSGVILQYKIALDGQLLPLIPEAVVMHGNHTTLIKDATGRFAYVSGDRESYTIAQYKFNSDGTLFPLSPPTISTGTNPFTLIILTEP